MPKKEMTSSLLVDSEKMIKEQSTTRKSSKLSAASPQNKLPLSQNMQQLPEDHKYDNAQGPINVGSPLPTVQAPTNSNTTILTIASSIGGVLLVLFGVFVVKKRRRASRMDDCPPRLQAIRALAERDSNFMLKRTGSQRLQQTKPTNPHASVCSSQYSEYNAYSEEGKTSDFWVARLMD